MFQGLKRMLGKLLRFVIPKDSDEGRRYIIRLEDPDEIDTWYMEWSTHAKAPLCRGLPKSEFRDWYLNKYKNYPWDKLEKRLDNVDTFGSDKPGSTTVEDIISNNKAGNNGYCLSKEEIIDKFCAIDENQPRLLGQQSVSLESSRQRFLDALSRQVKLEFPDIKEALDCLGGSFDPEREICAKLVLNFVEDELVTVSVEQNSLTKLWRAQLKSVSNVAEGLDEDRNVAICAAAVHWQHAIRTRGGNSGR